jgi:chaperonin GroEL
MDDGIVEGGGLAFLRAANNINISEKTAGESRDFIEGFTIVVNSVCSIFKEILKNAGINNEVVSNKVLETGLGFNALTGKYENLIDSGVIDPFKCLKSEITNAVATASTLLTSNVAIATVIKEK